MTWSAYGSFLVFAVVLVVIPGPDFSVITKNTLSGGRRRGTWSATGVASSNAVQGLAAAAGLGALITRAQPVFQAMKRAGIAYLAYLGIQAIRSAVAGRYADTGEPAAGAALLGFSAKLATE
jgi:threonine/homoserine/homoserine lactone efflux protein